MGARLQMAGFAVQHGITFTGDAVLCSVAEPNDAKSGMW
jgi:adenosylmethionine-8-amino-7-oxononanoate aminotransferase